MIHFIINIIFDGFAFITIQCMGKKAFWITAILIFGALMGMFFAFFGEQGSPEVFAVTAILISILGGIGAVAITSGLRSR